MKKQYRRVIKCKLCGENGARAGGLHKDGDDYCCNILSICGRVKIEKDIILSQRKEVR